MFVSRENHHFISYFICSAAMYLFLKMFVSRENHHFISYSICSAAMYLFSKTTIVSVRIHLSRIRIQQKNWIRIRIQIQVHVFPNQFSRSRRFQRWRVFAFRVVKLLSRRGRQDAKTRIRSRLPTSGCYDLFFLQELFLLFGKPWYNCRFFSTRFLWLSIHVYFVVIYPILICFALIRK